MEKRKLKIIAWLKSGMNYIEGIGLLMEFSGRKGFHKQFIGKENRMKDKLTYEICKAAKVADFSNWKDYTREYYNGNSNSQVDRSTKKEKVDCNRLDSKKKEELLSGLSDCGEDFNPVIIYGSRNDEYPILIKRVLFDLGNLYQQRSLLHTQMANMEQSNRKVVIKERVKLLDQIKAISDRFIFLYLVKQTYLKDRILPNERDIYPENYARSEVEKVEKLDIEDLKRQKKNLQTSNSKDQKQAEIHKNKLAIATNNFDASKLTILETRIRKRISMIEEIDYKLIND